MVMLLVLRWTGDDAWRWPPLSDITYGESVPIIANMVGLLVKSVTPSFTPSCYSGYRGSRKIQTSISPGGNSIEQAFEIPPLAHRIALIHSTPHSPQKQHDHDDHDAVSHHISTSSRTAPALSNEGCRPSAAVQEVRSQQYHLPKHVRQGIVHHLRGKIIVFDGGDLRRVVGVA